MSDSEEDLVVVVVVLVLATVKAYF